MPNTLPINQIVSTHAQVFLFLSVLVAVSLLGEAAPAPAPFDIYFFKGGFLA